MLPVTSISTEAVARPIPRPVGGLRRFSRVFFSRAIVKFGFAILLLVVLVAIFSPLVAPYDPTQQSLKETLAKPSSSHLLGTDQFGRDILSRMMFGSQISLLVGLVAIVIAGVIGITLGLLAGYFGGWVDQVIMRIIDAQMSIPPIMLVLVIAAVLGGGIKNVMISIGIGMIPTYCRLIYGLVLSTKETDFVTAAHVIGANNLRIMFFHLLPNCFPPMIVLLTLNMGNAIMSEASLSFLGIGISPPTATWGSMVNDGYHYLMTNPILSLAPGLAVLLVVVAFNLVGDGLRDALDPRLRGKI
jgi:peptide/nickel transport system permease protein